MDDLQTQVDTINETLDEMSSDFQDISDNIDQAQSDQQDTDNDFDTRLSDVEQSSGQLAFPLTQDTIDLINEQFPRGSFQLSGGTYTLKDARISPTSTILYSVLTSSNPTTSFLIPSQTVPVHIASTPSDVNVVIPAQIISSLVPLYYSVAITKGQAIFTSSIAGDTSTLGYLLLA